jgi:hypothetical protein
MLQEEGRESSPETIGGEFVRERLSKVAEGKNRFHRRPGGSPSQKDLLLLTNEPNRGRCPCQTFLRETARITTAQVTLGHASLT